MPGVDDADAARVADAVADEEVPLHPVPVAVAQRQHALRFEEDIAADHIVARFDRHYLHLAVAAVEEVLFDQRVRGGVGLLRGSDADGLRPVRAVDGPRSEPVVVDAVMIPLRTLLVEHHDQRDAQIQLACQRAMVHAVAAAVEQHVAVRRIAPRGVVVIHRALRQAAVLGHLPAVAELDHRARRGVSVAEVQAADLDPLAREAERRCAADHHASRRRRLDHDGAFFGARARPAQLHVGIRTVLDDDPVARLRRAKRS